MGYISSRNVSIAITKLSNIKTFDPSGDSLSTQFTLQPLVKNLDLKWVSRLIPPSINVTDELI